jgi:hypothetical protein
MSPEVHADVDAAQREHLRDGVGLRRDGTSTRVTAIGLRNRRVLLG